MPKTNDTDSDQKKIPDKKKKVFDPRVKGILIVGGLALIVLLGFTFAQHSGRIPFFTENFLSLVVVAAIAIQTLIYWQQREIMEKAADYTKIGDRAYIGIKGVRFENFGVGRKPKLIIKFLNGGKTPAWNLSIGSKLTIGTKFPTERPVVRGGSNLVPAGVEQEAEAQLPAAITAEQLKDIIEGRAKIFVRGEAHFRDAWRDKRKFNFNLVYRPLDDEFTEYKEEDEERNPTPTPHTS